MDNVGIVFADLDAAVAFFVELGLELDGTMTVEGEWSDRIVGLDGQRVDSPCCGLRTATASSS